MTPPSDFMPAGTRVQAHPATDAWMMGDRYGTVTKVGRKWVHVRMQSGRMRKFALKDDGCAWSTPTLLYA